MITLTPINTVPLKDEHFNPYFSLWLTTLVDTLNTIITQVQNALNQTSAPQYTTLQITALAMTAPNGTLWYDTTTNNLKALVNGVVVILA